jgi:REP element-mobilizing transposase RayT
MSLAQDGPIPPSKRATYGRGRTVRLDRHDYASDEPVHLTLCVVAGSPFMDRELAAVVCNALEEVSRRLGYTLYGYCLMPDHLHVVVSPSESETAIGVFLQRFKSFTTRMWQKKSGTPRLWQTSAYDRVLRSSEDPWAVAGYIADNPVRAGLVKKWTDWPWARVYCV